MMFLRRNSRLGVTISISSGLLFYLLAILFPDMDPHEAHLISSSWPDIMKDLFGDPAFAFADIYAWLHLQVFHITSWAIYGVYASILASRIVAREMEEKTLEILLSYPASRTSLLVSGTAGVHTLVLLGVIPGIIGCGLGIHSTDQEIHLLPIVLAGVECLLLSLVCASIALLISTCGGGQTLSICFSLAFISFMFLHSQMLSTLEPMLGKLDFMSPFHYYRVDEILVDGVYDYAALLFMAVYSFIPMIVAFMVFSKKDILV